MILENVHRVGNNKQLLNQGRVIMFEFLLPPIIFIAVLFLIIYFVFKLSKKDYKKKVSIGGTIILVFVIFILVMGILSFFNPFN